VKARLHRLGKPVLVLLALAVAAVTWSAQAPRSGLATATSGFGYGTPNLAIYPAPASLPNSNNAGEPSIGVNWNSGATMYQAYSSTYRVTFNDTSHPATATWADTAASNLVNIDPIASTDRVTGRTWSGGLAGSCSQLSYTDNDGATWSPSNPCTGTIDHETIGSGPWAGAAPLGATYPRALYYCAQASVDACVTSGNGGVTFGAPTPVNGVCGGLHGHVKVSADGTAYVPDNNCGANTGGFLTTSNGASWSSYVIAQAASPRRGFDPSVTTTPDNTLYQAWGRAGDFHPTVARSVDHGNSWDRVTDLAGTVSPALVASTFPAMVSGDNGRIAVAFLGTSVGTPGLTPFDNGYHGVWYLYVSYSYDGGQTWTTVNATPGDPVQRGCIWDGGGSNVCRNLLDFMDASVTRDGRVVVGFADGCIGACAGPAGTEAQSTSAYATIARQDTGRGLFAAFDTAAPSASPTASATPAASPTPVATPTPVPTPSASSTSSPSPSAPPSQLVSNGGFESGLAGWTTAGSGSAPAIVSAPVHSGSGAARLGAAGSCGLISCTEPAGDSGLYQSVNLPAGRRSVLSFWYWGSCADTVQYDWQQVAIRDSSGTVLNEVMKTCDNSQTYKQVTYDLTPYAGRTVQLYFNDHEDNGGDPTYFYLDDVAVTVS
jgi:hypothetical protein